MRRVSIAGKTVEAGRVRSVVTLGSGLALGLGLALGVASAAPPQGSSGGDAPPAPQTAQSAPPTQPAELLRRLPARRPLHQLLLARLYGQAQRTQSLGRVVTGRLVQITGNSATIQTAPDQTRVVRVTPQTRLPGRRPQPGDLVLAVGRPAPDGVLIARAIAVRRAAPRTASPA